ncbi:BTAD domain-containing putative transcriptional regulator [Pseudooceanicola sp. MF1-13]|uniref:AfsR/SARP family transcriptional regulator n=1 Tax=Pseudooceanicola sp. MF1-13 TaxID=3379095 RepID=UPI0038923EDC
MSADPTSHPVEIAPDRIVNAALFWAAGDTMFTSQTLAPWLATPGCYVMSADETFLSAATGAHRLDVVAQLPDTPEVSSDQILTELGELFAKHPDLTCLIVDMSWALNVVWGATMIERWGAIADRAAEAHGVAIICLYDRETLVEDQMAATFRAHRAFLSPSGLYNNPHWLPQNLLDKASLDEQLSFLLGRIVPEFADRSFRKTQLPDAARGTTPGWVPTPHRHVASHASEERWHIHCLGRLQVYVRGGAKVDWTIAGAAPKKSRALFAYLLTRGETGCPAEQLCEFLWPDDRSEEVKRGRLRHTIAMVRKSLGGIDAVTRSGDIYYLNVPKGSWIDIRAFEQLCRRGLALFRHNDFAAALRVYEGAERLYRGDLFEDLPMEYVQSDYEDWCMPRRIWLHDMAVKLQYDMSKALRQLGRFQAALDHSQKALRLDPTNESATIEVMRVFAAQDRKDAVARQYQQYLNAVREFDAGAASDEVLAVSRELLGHSSTRRSAAG